MDPRSNHAVALFGALYLLTLTGCSPFHQAWRAADDAPAEGGIVGRWEGSWRSSVNGHNGRLRCVIEPLELDPENQYLARYHAVYAGFLTFAYDVPIHVTREGEVVRFEGQADLGELAGGVYHYTGQIDHPDEPEQSTFHATYKAKSDEGVFELRR